MDKEILFRGFHKEPNGKDIAIINDTKEHGTWLYGNLLRTDDGWYIIQNYIPSHMLSRYEVAPSTVDQYTGLTDKNGVKIFEGDIVAAGYYKWKCQVVWDEECARFICYTFEGERRIVYVDMTDKDGKSALEVIGNVHDNPELIGGEVDG